MKLNELLGVTAHMLILEIGQAAQQREDVINKNIQDLQEKDKAIAELTSLLNEANSRSQKLQEQLSGLRAKRDSLGDVQHCFSHRLGNSLIAYSLSTKILCRRTRRSQSEMSTLRNSLRS